ncbi:MAG: hypothetical protein BA865_01960 [Desulfobacterales bacterium S5133MH4]|nr:MAG: hypothetical protein BA865_01960 [Desulfobacterales bacterium S5133MH4]
MQRFAVLQLTGCAGCEVSLLNAEEWVDQHELVYMPLVTSAYSIPEVDLLLVTGSVQTDEDLYKLRNAVRRANRVVAVGTCAISGGVLNLGDREETGELFLAEESRRDLPRLLPRCRPIDTVVSVDQYLPGCPPTPELFMALLFDPPDFKIAKTVCQECGRKKDKKMRPTHLLGFQHGMVLPDICLVNQGYLCIGTSTRGGCRALCTRAGQPCVGCRGPSDLFIEKGSKKWFATIQRVFSKMTDIPVHEIEAALRSPQLSLFLSQFSHYAHKEPHPKLKAKVL